jgi:type II secretory pathway component PulF
MTPPPATTSRWASTAIWLAVLLALHLLLAIALVVIVPGQKKTFDEYNLQLPWLTKVVIDAGSLSARFWWAILPTLISATVVGVILGRHAFRRPTVGTVFAVLCLFGLLAALTAIAFALTLPQIKLAEGMAK